MRNKIIIACVIFIAFIACLFIVLKPDKSEESVTPNIQEQIDLGDTPDTAVEEFIESNTTSVVEEDVRGFTFTEGTTTSDISVEFTVEGDYKYFKNDVLDLQLYALSNENFGALVNYMLSNDLVGNISMHELDMSNPGSMEEMEYDNLTYQAPNFTGRYVYRGYRGADTIYIYSENGSYFHYVYTEDM